MRSSPDTLQALCVSSVRPEIEKVKEKKSEIWNDFKPIACKRRGQTINDSLQQEWQQKQWVGFKVNSFSRYKNSMFPFACNLQHVWIIILYKASLRLRLKLERDWRGEKLFWNLCALGMISAYIFLDVPFCTHTSIPLWEHNAWSNCHRLKMHVIIWKKK